MTKIQETVDKTEYVLLLNSCYWPGTLCHGNHGILILDKIWDNFISRDICLANEHNEVTEHKAEGNRS